jgi:hypothetical protein
MSLPLRPEELVDIEAIGRGELYNVLDLCPLQRGCAEQARRMVLDGRYGEEAPHG